MTLLSRAGVTALSAAALVFLGAGVASAHVTVNPNESAAGSYAKLTFRVPNESSTASTVSVKVDLPTDHPFPSVSLMPVPGWTATTSTATLNPPVTEGDFVLDEATDSVTWTADDGVGVRPGEFMEFSLSVGPVPAASSIALPATQTYSDGTVVAWAEIASGDQDPHSLDHPAPVLTVTDGAAGHDGSVGDGTADSGDTLARLLAGGGLALGAVALMVALRKKPREQS